MRIVFFIVTVNDRLAKIVVSGQPRAAGYELRA
jgi:hypothetical protein